MCWAVRVDRVRASRRREDSASRRRRSRACWRVERDSLMREMACLSGAMLKFWRVWEISWGFVSNCVSLGENIYIYMCVCVCIYIVILGESAYSRGVFFEEHFGGLGMVNWLWKSFMGLM